MQKCKGTPVIDAVQGDLWSRDLKSICISAKNHITFQRTQAFLLHYRKADRAAQQLSELVQVLDQSRVFPIRTADGELITDAEHYEFFVDEASLWEIVKRVYCQ